MKRLFLLMLVSLLFTVGCSSTPTEYLTKAAQDIRLLNKVSVKRNRAFTIPAYTHLALVYSPALKEHLPKKPQRLGIYDDNKSHFGHVFSQIHLIREGQQIPRGVDYLVRIDLVFLDKQTQLVSVLSKSDKHRDAMEALGLESDEIKKDQLDIGYEKTTKVRTRKRPIKMVIKFNLFDARTNKLLDVAIAHGRSGVFTKNAVEKLFNQSVSAYAQNITSTQKIEI
jgi:hypothetical protein